MKYASGAGVVCVGSYEYSSERRSGALCAVRDSQGDFAL